MKPPDEKRPIGPRQVLAVLLPILGCGVLVWQGAHRPERMILGKWMVQGQNRTIEFESDNTFIEVDQVSVVASASYDPFSTSESPTFTPGRLDVFRRWGYYRFLDRKHLSFELRGEEENGKQTFPESPPQQSIRGRDNPLPNVDVEIEGDQVQVTSVRGEIWKRIE